MTKEEIIEMAKQADIDIGMWEKLSDNDDVFGYDFCGIHENLEAFTKLVAEKERDACTAHAITAAEKAIDVAIKLEREACAKMCDLFQARDVGMQPAECAGAIRARGNHD